MRPRLFAPAPARGRGRTLGGRRKALKGGWGGGPAITLWVNSPPEAVVREKKGAILGRGTQHLPIQHEGKYKLDKDPFGAASGAYAEGGLGGLKPPPKF